MWISKLLKLEYLDRKKQFIVLAFPKENDQTVEMKKQHKGKINK